jgi:hypothetical protein
VSNVTDVIVTASLLDDDKLLAVNEYFRLARIADGFSGDGAPYLVDAKTAWRERGIGKAMQAEVWIGAFKYMEHRDFLAHLRTVKWADPGEVQVFMNFENGEKGFQRVEWRQERQAPDDTDRWMEP